MNETDRTIVGLLWHENIIDMLDKMPKELFTIAFDLGGVIFSGANDNIIFSQKYLETELTPGIYDIIIELSKDESNKLIIISKAYPNNAKKSKEILKLYGLDDYFISII